MARKVKAPRSKAVVTKGRPGRKPRASSFPHTVLMGKLDPGNPDVLIGITEPITAKKLNDAGFLPGRYAFYRLEEVVDVASKIDIQSVG